MFRADIKASWTGRQSAEVGKHLAEIALARGDKNVALTYYDLAIATEPQYDGMGVHKELDAMGKAMAVEADKLRKAGAHSAAGGPAGLQKARTLTIGPGPDGYADYKLLVNAKGIVKFEPVGEKSLPDAAKQMSRVKLEGLFPPGSTGQLVMVRILNCHQGTCELVAPR